MHATFNRTSSKARQRSYSDKEIIHCKVPEKTVFQLKLLA